MTRIVTTNAARPAAPGRRGFVLGGGVLDTERAAHIVLDEFRAGKIARVTLDDPREEKNAPEK